MALTTALYTGLTGLNANSLMISVAGNNIANSNTAAFKKSRVNFQTQISQTLASGSAPRGQMGGSNPLQVGLGVRPASVTRDFTGGALQPTGVSTDMSIDGNGFFIVKAGEDTRYTRAGNFGLDSGFNLVTANGALVQGYGVNEDYEIAAGVMNNIRLPIGVQTLAEATTSVNFAGNLNAGGDAATQGSQFTTQPMFSDAAATVPATAATALSSLYDASGTPMFSTGDVITITDAAKGGATLPDYTFEVGAANTTGSDANGTTLADLGSFFEDIFGIDTSLGGGVSVAGGVLQIDGNTGEVNDLTLNDTNLVVNKNTSPTTPMDFTRTQAADGESVRTTFVAYDSLGNEMTIDVSIVLEQKSDAGTTWRFYAQSTDDTDLDRHLGTGTLQFSPTGTLTSASDLDIIIDRTDTGAETPQNITLAFADPFGSMSALADRQSRVNPISQDGAALGTLEDFSVGDDGVIVGLFSNSMQRVLGQIPLATFINNGGLKETATNLYAATPSSGDAAVTIAGTGAAGKVTGRALEMSNVDLAEEFTSLITASTGFSANSRVLTTSDQLMQELMNAVR